MLSRPDHPHQTLFRTAGAGGGDQPVHLGGSTQPGPVERLGEELREGFAFGRYLRGSRHQDHTGEGTGGVDIVLLQQARHVDAADAVSDKDGVSGFSVRHAVAKGCGAGQDGDPRRPAPVCGSEDTSLR